MVDTTLIAGTRLGPYEIVAPLGAGGMGEVYRARDSRLGRDVALKILPDSMASDAEGLARFEREARAVAALNHPNIVTIFSTEQAGGVRFLTMELIEGRPLDQIIAAGGVSMVRLFDVGIALADALSAAHHKRITHRDLKPANVMLADDGRVKVLDFGLSRPAEPEPATTLEDQATRQRLTQAGTILGTMPYMSPEQIEARALDGRSDIFSLGIVLYEMATGTRPFQGETSAALMSSIMKDHPRPVAELRPDVPEGVAQVVTRCLEKSARDRIQTAQEILIELRSQRRAWESGSSQARPRPVTSATPAERGIDLRIAVMPFVARPAGGDAQVLADGLTDDVAAGLARFSHLRVVSRAEVDRLAGQVPDAAGAARIRARYFLDGTVRTAGSAQRVSAKLVDAETGAHLWAENYDRPLAQSIFELQDDLVARIVTAVAEGDGALARSMVAATREREVGDLSVDELVLRYAAYTHSFRAEEHAQLRAGLEAALAAQPTHAWGWACLGNLYILSQDQNPLPDWKERAAEAAERCIEIDPHCQLGWRLIAAGHFFDRDRNGLRMAAEKTIGLNPFNSSTQALIGMLLAYSGDWERGVAIVRRMMDLNPRHSGWYHYPVAVDHYRRGEFEDALGHAKRSRLPQYVFTPLSTAAAAGQLGRAPDARAALESLRKYHPAYLDREQVRRHWSLWLWEEEVVESLVAGFAEAQAVAAAEPAPASGAARRPASGPAASIAVLPFTDLSAEKDQDWFCDGIAEEILTTLSQIKGLSVAARASAFSFRGRGDDLKAIGDKLHVTTVLDGSVRRAGDRLRITVRLADVANGYQIWTERYERAIKDVFDVQDEIARAVAERLRVGFAGQAPRGVRHTQNQEAYHLYLRGRHLWYARSKGSLQRARQLFEEATQKDSDYALPYVGLAELFVIQALYGYEREDVAAPQAKQALARALELNDQVADAHRARGLVALFLDWEPMLGVTAFERSIELDPTNGLSYIWLGWPTWPGREAAAVAAASKAQELDPLNPYIHSLAGSVHEFYGRGHEGVAHFERAFEIDPNYPVGLYLGGGVFSRIGRHEEALGLFARAVEISDRAPFYVSYHAWALARAGRTAEARAALAELEARAATEHVRALERGIVHAALGELDRAFELLDAAVRARDGWIGCPRMPMFAELRGDPRFSAHLRRIQHPDASA